MLQSLSLLQLLLIAAIVSADAKRPVQCPELRPDNICPQAEAGFAYSDGCNRVRCLKGGIYAVSRRGCPSAETSAELRQCRQAAGETFARMEPVTCSNVNPERVCSRHGAGFSFSDGCNGLECGEDGSVSSSTMRGCQTGDPEGAYCQYMENLVSDNEEENETGDEEEEAEYKRSSTHRSKRQQRRRRSDQEFTCPDLSASAICKWSTNGFTYSDGCNTITCHGNGMGQSTYKFCPVAEASDSAGQTYCQEAEREMQAKMKQSSLRSRCLEPEDVCRGETAAQIFYYNGCNRCFCGGPGEAACTRRACPKVLMTDDEFAVYCEQRGAGIR